MSKRLALKDYIEVDGVDISNDVHRVGFTSTDERVDVSGFNTTGASEFLTGTRVREIQLDVWVNRASGHSRQVLYPLHRDRSTFDFVWRPDGSTSVSATNPELRGEVLLPEWSEGAGRGEAETTSITLIQASEDSPLEFYAT